MGIVSPDGHLAAPSVSSLIPPRDKAPGERALASLGKLLVVVAALWVMRYVIPYLSGTPGTAQQAALAPQSIEESIVTTLGLICALNPVIRNNPPHEEQLDNGGTEYIWHFDAILAPPEHEGDTMMDFVFTGTPPHPGRLPGDLSKIEIKFVVLPNGVPDETANIRLWAVFDVISAATDNQVTANDLTDDLASHSGQTEWRRDCGTNELIFSLSKDPDGTGHGDYVLQHK